MDSDAQVRFGLACVPALCSLATAAADGLPEAGESLLFADIPSVFGASKYEQSLQQAPASVSIISADEIALDGRVSYACQLGAEDRTRHALSNSPQQLIKLNLSTPPLRERVLAGVETQYTSQRLTKDGSHESNTLTNVTISNRRWIWHLDISANIYNLFDTAYADTAADIYTQNTIPQDGRIYRIKAKYEL
jgi:outer membrane receptor protein involved in Fe transport